MLSKKLFRIRASRLAPCAYSHAALVAAFTKIRRRFKINYLPAGSHFANGALHCTFTVACLESDDTTSITLVGGEPQPGAGMVAAHKVAEITLLHIWFGIPVISKEEADQLSPMALLCFLISKATNKQQAFREADPSLFERLSEEQKQRLCQQYDVFHFPSMCVSVTELPKQRQLAIWEKVWHRLTPDEKDHLGKLGINAVGIQLHLKSGGSHELS